MEGDSRANATKVAFETSETNSKGLARGNLIQENLWTGGIHGSNNFWSSIAIEIGEGEGLGVAGEKKATLV